jgi:hypothetical protein
VNGRKIAIHEKPGSYITLHRKWANGDRIEVTYPMSLHLLPAPDDPSKAAIAYGPIVLAGEMGRTGMRAPAPYAPLDNPYAYYTYDYKVPADLVHTIDTHGNNVDSWLKADPGAGPLTFRTVNATDGGAITLEPYYRIHDQRYVVYWDVK